MALDEPRHMQWRRMDGAECMAPNAGRWIGGARRRRAG